MYRSICINALVALLLVTSAASAGIPTAKLSPALPRVTAGFAADMASLPASRAYGAIVHFQPDTAPAGHRALLARLGLQVAYDFERFAGALYVLGPVSAFRELQREPAVRYLERSERQPLLSNTASWATRVRVLQEAVAGGPYYDANGEILNGKGVGLAIVDSGVNTPHPDLVHRTAKNLRVTCPDPLTDETALGLCQLTDFGTALSSDIAGGHGTHCAGIAVGDGSASNGGYPLAAAAPATEGTYTGAAPGASLYAFGAGAGISIVTVAAAASFNWILENNADLDPKIRVVSNSYGGGDYDPESLLSKLTVQLVEQGVVVVFAAGNDGGSGADDGSENPSKTSGYCRDPTPGVICVANYNDVGTGARDSTLDTSSSRAAMGHLGDYPDIAAPGSNITATCNEAEAPNQAICATGAELNWAPYYGTISGTSMATPHVAGIVALIAQARPDLSPAEIENVIKDSARKVNTNGVYESDPNNPDGTFNFGFGAGLIDAPAIMAKLGVRHDVPPAQGVETVVIDGDEDSSVAGAADIVKLTLQEAIEGGLPGLVYRLTLRDAADFGSSSDYALVVHNDVNGVALSTRVDSNAQGVTIPPSDDSEMALATRAGRNGNVVDFFVPYAALGYPPPQSPIHNIRVEAQDAGGSVVDYAPSPLTPSPLPASLRPMYGRPFTIQLDAGAAPPSTEKSCELPGLTMISSPGGVSGATGLPGKQDDLRRVWFAEPADMDGKLVVTLKMDNLATLPPNLRWSVNLRLPDVAETYFVAMDTSRGPLPVYNFGTYKPVELPVAAVGTYSVLGDLDAASSHDADGTIALVIDKATFPTPIVPGMQLSGISASIRITSTSAAGGVGLTQDSAGATRDYDVVGNVCVAGPAAPGSPGGSGNSGGPGIRGPNGGGGGGGGLGLELLLPLALVGWRRQRRCRQLLRASD